MPSVGSYDRPFQLPPPTVLGNVTIVPSTPGGVYGRKRVEVLLRIEGVSRERSGFDREWLRRRRLLAWNAALRHGPFLEAEYRLPCRPIENEQQPHLRDLGDGRNGAAVALHIDQRGRGGQIVVPQVVMNELLIPLQLSCCGVERDERVSIQVRAFAIAAVIVRCR